MTFDLQTGLIPGGAAILVVILLWLMLRARFGRQSIRQEPTEQIEPSADPYAATKERPYMKAAVTQPPATAPPAAPPATLDTTPAIDVGIPAGAPPAPDPDLGVVQPAVPFAGEFGGIAFPPRSTDHADELTRLKGVGPKLAALLNEQGITRYEQLASLSGEEAAAIDARLGNFEGRLARDRVVEQARLLANGDTDAFEAQFGKLGGV